MIPSHRIPTHPGEILLEEFLVPLGITQVQLAAHIAVPTQRVNELVRGKRGVTPDTAWLLSKAFSTSPEFWLNLQSIYDLSQTRPQRTIRPMRKVSCFEPRRLVFVHLGGSSPRSGLTTALTGPAPAPATRSWER